MKKYIWLFICCISYNSILHSQKTFIELNENWKFRKFGDTSGWIPAIVPGCVHTDLFANKIIPDPFYGTNEAALLWIEREDWEYKTQFYVDRKFLTQKYIQLEFEGLDTYADVYLNDSLILQADNMFREWNVDIGSILKKGKNNLYIKFRSAVNTGKELMNNYPIKLPAEERVFTRKAQYQYGWDWGPRFATCGIWKSVNITGSSVSKYAPTARIEFKKLENNIAVCELILNDKKYKLQKSDFPELQDLHLQIKNKESGIIYYDSTITASHSYGNPITFNIPEPKLWWCHTLGEPYLYDLEVNISDKKKNLYSFNVKTGLNTIELVQENDLSGSAFYFKINDVPVFAKGANWIPLNSFPSSITKDDYRKILMEAKSMHINMLRVWGGGIYESEYFYELCDSLGIMVWQDLMFACAIYPFDETNADNYKYEALDITYKLENHPCLALVCGNNENDEGWINWGWQKQFNYSQADSITIGKMNKQLFHSFFPNSIMMHDINISYFPSSPSNGYGHPESLTEGDCHYWGVWWGKEPFEVFNNKIPRFMSEYGFQGMPAFNSFKKFIPQDELFLGSPSIKNHQKHPVGYETIDEYMQRDYIVPQKFEDYIYISQLLQADGMQTAIEAHRRNKPYCMGTLFWQLNDCWPVTSWSVIDHYGSRKASYYKVRKKYDDVIISSVIENDTVRIYVVSDLQDTLKRPLMVWLMNTNGDIIKRFVHTMNIPPNSSNVYYELPINEIDSLNKSELVLYSMIRAYKDDYTDNYFLFTKPKDVELSQPNFYISVDTVNNYISFSTDVFAKGIYLYSDERELKLSENFFDLGPGPVKTIYFEEPQQNLTLEELKVKCLNTVYGN